MMKLWVGRIKDAEGTTVPDTRHSVAWEQPYKVGDTRAVMIEGPGREALELVDKK